MDNGSNVLLSGTLMHHGEYRVVRHIASGGFGNTYEVEQMDDELHKHLCMKEFFMPQINQREGNRVTVTQEVNRPSFEQLRKQFITEAKRLAMLDANPHIVDVVKCFEENDTAYYVMKLIQGESLSGVMSQRGKPFSEGEVRQMLPQLLSALSFIHQKGLRHLDLKPGNIMRSLDGNLWLIDFGSSKQVAMSADSSLRLTLSKTGQLTYTPRFAPQELVFGNTKYIGPWTDIYSLGATLYCLLTNLDPPEVDDVRFEREAAFSFPSNLSADMRSLILWMMQPDHDKRPQSAEQVSQWLNDGSADGGSAASGHKTAEATAKKDEGDKNKTHERKSSSAVDITGDTLRVKASMSDETVKRKGKEERRSEATKKAATGNQPVQRKSGRMKMVVAAILMLALTGLELWIVMARKSGSVSGSEKTVSYTIKGIDERTDGSGNITFNLLGTGISFTMVYVEGGTFTMGATNEQGDEAFDWEKPTHSVTLSDYYIGEAEVTQALWEAVMDSNPSHFTGDGNLPVENVSWEDCQEFISKLNNLTGRSFKLPTEAQWEYAARGGRKSNGYKYSGSNDLDSVAWYDDNIGGETHPVKTKKANELGIYDMSGNVWEWCSDWYGDYTSSSQTDPTGSVSGSERVLRGGCWGNYARGCRCSDRGGSTPTYRYGYLGLRLAL